MAKATSKVRTERKKTSRSSAATKKKAAEPKKPEPEPESDPDEVLETDSAIDAETHAKYEEIKRGNIHIKELQRMTVQELHAIAKDEGLEEYTGLKKQDLIFKIMKGRINRSGLMFGERPNSPMHKTTVESSRSRCASSWSKLASAGSSAAALDLCTSKLLTWLSNP